MRRIVAPGKGKPHPPRVRRTARFSSGSALPRQVTVRADAGWQRDYGRPARLASQDGHDLATNPIPLCISQAAEVLAEQVYRHLYHPVGEHDAVIGLGCIGGGAVAGAGLDLGDQHGRPARGVVDVRLHHHGQLSFCGQRGWVGDEDIALARRGVARRRHRPVFHADNARLRDCARACRRSTSSASASIIMWSASSRRVNSAFSAASTSPDSVVPALRACCSARA